MVLLPKEGELFLRDWDPILNYDGKFQILFGYDLTSQIFLRKHSFEIANLSTLFLHDILGKMNFVRKLLSKQ